MNRQERHSALLKAVGQRILVIDGAMGTMIQKEKLQEADYRGKRFADWPSDLKGNNELLNLTQPAIIRGIHSAFLEVGADIIETNSFNGTQISMADYDMQSLAAELSLESAKMARSVADEWTAKTPNKPRFVAGAIGPLNKTLSISPDVNNPGFRAVTFDEVVASYIEQIEALIEGGVDILLIETVFDTLNAKAAIFAAEEVFAANGFKLPIMISFTVTDMSGRNLSGQTIEAFWYSVRHAKPFSIGLNCAFGAEHLRPHAIALSGIADTHVCVYPNAGLPNELGEYDEEPRDTAGHLGAWAKEGLLNITGGCCGTTPQHIAAIAAAVEGVSPRAMPNLEPAMRLSGIDPAVLLSTSEV